MAFGKRQSANTQSARVVKPGEEGMSRLKLAWLALAFCAAILLGSVALFGSPEDARPELAIEIDGQIDRYAVNDPAAYRPLEGNIYATQNTSQTIAAPQQETATQTVATAQIEQKAPEAPIQSEEAQTLPAETLPAETLPTVTRDVPAPTTNSASTSKTINVAEALANTKDAPIGKSGHILVPDDGADVVDALSLPLPGEERVQTAPKRRPIGAAPAHANAALFHTTKDGPYPRIAQDGRKSSSYYARSFSDPENRPRIALIVGGLGLNANITQRAINELPPEVTLAFAPYAKDLESWAAQAKARGHEIVLELPMEARGYAEDQLGPASLLTTRTEAENRQRLNWLMSRFSGYFAVTNYLGGKITATEDKFSPILFQLRAAGVAYIDDSGITQKAMKRGDLPHAIANVTITSGNKSINEQLSEITKMTDRNQHALVKVYASDSTLTTLSTWLSGLDGNTVSLAPASSLIRE